MIIDGPGVDEGCTLEIDVIGIDFDDTALLPEVELTGIDVSDITLALDEIEGIDVVEFDETGVWVGDAVPDAVLPLIVLLDVELLESVLTVEK